MIAALIGLAYAQEPPEPDDGCRARPDVLEVQGEVARAETAFGSLDAAGFAQARDALYEAVPCLSEPLTSSAAAGFFRVRALDAYLRRAPGDLEVNLAAVGAIDPAPLPSTVVPRGHPVRNTWEALRAREPSPTTLLAVPDRGRLRVDGFDTLLRATERPTVLQFVGIDGVVGWTRLVEPGQPVPAYPEAPESARLAYETAVVVRAPRRPVELPIVAGLLAAGAIGTYLVTVGTSQGVLGDGVEPDAKPAVARTNNALVLTSAGLGVASAGVGAWAVIAW